MNLKARSTQSIDEVSQESGERIRRIENAFASICLVESEPPFRVTLQKLMELYKVPGLSVAVIDDFRIAWAKGYGVTEIGATTPVTIRTLFQAGSISKPLAAVGALSLVEQGKLSLDEDVNRKLVSWKVPENEFTQDNKVTLRRILSHSAGLTVHGFDGYVRDEPLPTLVQILDGEKPANNLPVRVDFFPGARWRYSGGGISIAQQLMIDVAGMRFPEFMRGAVLSKIGLEDSTFEQPLPKTRQTWAASGTNVDGTVVQGKWHVHPEMAAAGLWTTPSDLAKFAIEVALSRQGRSNNVLSQTTTREMLRPQVEQVTEFSLGNENNPDRIGLGFFLGDRAHSDVFGHVGSNKGFQAMLIVFGDSGQGAVIMVNSHVGIVLGDYLMTKIAQEYDWDYVQPDRVHPQALTVLFVVAQMKGTEAAIRRYWKLKDANLPDFKVDKNTLLYLGYRLLFESKVQDAIEVMKLGVHENPKYWNAYDSLAEVYLQSGDRQHAIEFYERSVELNPHNQNGIRTLRMLKEQVRH